MNKIQGQTFIVILIVYILAFTASFAFSVMNFSGISVIGEPLEVQGNDLNMDIQLLGDNPESENQVLFSFKSKWILYNSIRLFIQYLIPIQSTALIIGFSLLFPWKLGSQGMQLPFVDIIGKSILLFLFLTLFFTGMNEVLLPMAVRNQDNQLYSTQIAVEYFQLADKIIESDKSDKDYPELVNLLKSYLKIDPGNAVIMDAMDWAKSMDAIKSDDDESAGESEIRKIENGETAADLIGKAKGFYEREDYFSALFYANRAFELDSSREDAQRIAAESREAIRSTEPDHSEKAAKTYFQRKMEGFNALNEGRPIEAYYIFKDIINQSEGDPDAPEFLDRSRNAISEISFFIDEAEEYKDLPGLNNITFINEDNTIIRIGKMIIAGVDRAFMYDIELITLTETGEILQHLTAPFGKLTEPSTIIMRAIDRDSIKLRKEPLYIEGDPTSPENVILKVEPGLDELAYLGQEGKSTDGMNILELYKLSKVLKKFGYISEPAEIAILERAVKPFTFLIVSFFSVSMAWLGRIRKDGFPWLAFLLTPVIPFILDNIFSFYQYGVKLLLGFALFSTGFHISLIILAASQAIILFLAFVTIAGQKT